MNSKFRDLILMEYLHCLRTLQ